MGLVCVFVIKQLQDWLNNKGGSIQYSSIRLFNPQYELDKRIALLTQPKESRHIGLFRMKMKEPTYYSIDVEVSVTSNSLEGQFRVKEVRTVALFMLDNDPLMGYALLIGDKKDVLLPWLTR